MTVLVKTWFCASCGYVQQWDPYSSPDSVASLQKIYPGIATGECPACYANRKLSSADRHKTLEYAQSIQDMADTSLSTNPVVVSVASEDGIDNSVTLEYDANGRPVMVDTGETRKEFDQVSGSVIDVPVLEQQTRPITQEEASALYTKREDALRKIDDVGIGEIAETVPEGV